MLHLVGRSAARKQGNRHLKREGALPARLLSRAAIALASAALLASCSSTGDPIERLGLTPQMNATAIAPTGTVEAADDDFAVAAAQTGYTVRDEDGPIQPELANTVPTPGSGEPVAPQTAIAQASAPAPQQPVEVAAAPTQADIDTVVQTRIGPAGAVIENISPPAAPPPATVAAPPKKRGLFASLFGADEQPNGPQQQRPAVIPAAVPDAQQVAPPVQGQQHETVASEPAPAEPAETEMAVATTFIENRPPVPAVVAGPKKRSFLSSFFSNAQAAPAPVGAVPAPIVDATARPLTLAAAAPAPVQTRAFIATDPLPGVRQGNLFEITRKSGIDDDSDIDLHEGGEEIQMASAAGLARLAPNGLLMQTDRVDVACLKPSLVRVLRTIEGHYGKKVIVTSGYRSPPVNRKARGARNSLHMYCAAADIQVAGVAKWELAEFLRAMPGRGGVGTYCHTNSVHVDVGPERDWNWRCRKRKRA